MSEATQAATERLLADLDKQSTEQWIEFRRGGVLPSYVDWLCSLAAEKHATNEDEWAYYWLQNWKWLTASDEAAEVLERTLYRMRQQLWPELDLRDYPQGGDQ